MSLSTKSKSSINLKENFFEDVTNEMLENATPNSHKILNKKFYIAENGIRYNLRGKDVVEDCSYDEKETAILIEAILGGEFYINPRVNKPEGIETADYFFRGNNWDKKRLTNATSKKRAVDNAIKNKQEQSKRFILDITGCRLTNEEIIEQVKNIFIPNKYQRDWVKEIIIIRDKKLLKYFRKK